MRRLAKKLAAILVTDYRPVALLSSKFSLRHKIRDEILVLEHALCAGSLLEREEYQAAGGTSI